MQNNLTWEGYEKITAYIIERLRQEKHIKIEGVGNSCKFRGTSGVEHQIDVLTSETDGINHSRTAIECKYWNKKINKDTVMKLREIVADCNFQTGIIVCRKGFTKDAKKFAENYNIKLVELREREQSDHPIESDLEIGILYNIISVNLMRPVITNIKIETEDSCAIILQETDPFYIDIAEGQKLTSFQTIMIFKRDISNEIPDKEIVKQYDMTGCILYHKGNKHRIKSICFTGLLTEINKDYNSTISIVDKVWLIMKSLFESKTFVISENGAISEYEDKKK